MLSILLYDDGNVMSMDIEDSDWVCIRLDESIHIAIDKI